MSGYAVMPKADYVAICDAIRDKKGNSETFKSGDIPIEIDKVYEEGHDAGYNEGFGDGEEQGYDYGYTDGWDFGENSGTEDGFEVGVGMGEDVQAIMAGTVYRSGDFNGTYSIDIENPKQLVITTTDECVFYMIEFLDTDDNSYVLAEDLVLEPGTHTLDIERDGQKQIYLSGSYQGLVGVSVTNRPSYDEGYGTGLAEGVEQGKQAEYDAFWDMHQANGTRTDQQYAFYNWSAENINPKHPIKATSIYGTFWLCVNLKRAPMVYYVGDGFTNMFRAFHSCINMEEIPFDIVMNATDPDALNQAFAYCRKLKAVKLVLDSTAYTFTYAFSECYALEELTIEGEINSNGMNLSACPLTHDSLMSVIDHLKNFGGTTETRSITFGATNLAKLTDAEKQIATGKGWTLA